MKLPLAYFRLVTFAYIAFPLLPFFGGWVKPLVGYPLIGLLCLGGFIYGKSLNYTEMEVLPKRDLWIGLFIISIWLLFSGAGGMGYQFYDHVKNNTLTKELSNLSWPLTYEVEGKKMFLSHYLSFYVVGPFVGGFLSYSIAQLVTFLWTALGVYLGVFWLARACGGLSWKFFLFFILFGGISVFAFVFKYGGDFLSEIIHRVNEHGFVFWMNSWDVIPLNYLHITDMLYWTPQHFIPAILGIGLILNDGLVDKNIKYTPFLLSLLVMWSPLILVGLFPFFLFSLFKNKFKGVFNPVNLLIAPIIFGVLSAYLLAIESGDLVKHFIFTGTGKELRDQIFVFIYFVFFEAIIWLVPIYYIRKGKWKSGEKSLFWLLSAVLILIPLYRFGLWNDWCNRVSMPAIVLLSVFGYQSFTASKSLKRIWIVVLISLAAIGPLMDIYGSAKYSGFKPKFRPPYEQDVQSLPEICISYPITQFVASEDTFFFKYLAKKPKIKPHLK